MNLSYKFYRVVLHVLLFCLPINLIGTHALFAAPVNLYENIGNDHEVENADDIEEFRNSSIKKTSLKKKVACCCLIALIVGASVIIPCFAVFGYFLIVHPLDTRVCTPLAHHDTEHNQNSNFLVCCDVKNNAQINCCLTVPDSFIETDICASRNLDGAPDHTYKLTNNPLQKFIVYPDKESCKDLGFYTNHIQPLFAHQNDFINPTYNLHNEINNLKIQIDEFILAKEYVIKDYEIGRTENGHFGIIELEHNYLIGIGSKLMNTSLRKIIDKISDQMPGLKPWLVTDVIVSKDLASSPAMLALGKILFIVIPNDLFSVSSKSDNFFIQTMKAFWKSANNENLLTDNDFERILAHEMGHALQSIYLKLSTSDYSMTEYNSYVDNNLEYAADTYSQLLDKRMQLSATFASSFANFVAFLDLLEPGNNCIDSTFDCKKFMDENNITELQSHPPVHCRLARGLEVYEAQKSIHEELREKIRNQERISYRRQHDEL